MKFERRALVIHPEFATLKKFAAMLEKEGFESLIAEDVEQAKEQIACQHFVLILAESALASELEPLPEGTCFQDLYDWLSQRAQNQLE